MSTWPTSWRPSAPTYQAGSGSQESGADSGGVAPSFVFPPGFTPPPAAGERSKPKRPPAPPRVPPRVPPVGGAGLGGLGRVGRRLLLGAARLHPVGRAASMLMTIYDLATAIAPKAPRPAGYEANGWTLVKQCSGTVTHGPLGIWAHGGESQACGYISTGLLPAPYNRPQIVTNNNTDYYTQFIGRHSSEDTGTWSGYSRYIVRSWWRIRKTTPGAPTTRPKYVPASPGRPAVYLPEPRRQWDRTKPVPALYPAVDPFVPPGEVNPDPLPLPYPVIPHRRPNPWRSPVEQPDFGTPQPEPETWPDAYPKPWEQPIKEIVIEVPVPQPGAVVPRPSPGAVVPSPAPVPGTGTTPETGSASPIKRRLPVPEVQPAVARYVPRHNPVRAGVKERKIRISVGRTVLAVVGHVGEGMELVDILFEALPDHLKPGYKLVCRKRGCAYEQVWRASPWQRIKAVYRHFDQVDLQKFVQGYAYNAVEDRFYGELGRRLGDAGARLGKPVGLGTGPWDTVMGDMTSWSYDPTTGRWTDPLEHIR